MKRIPAYLSFLILLSFIPISQATTWPCASNIMYHIENYNPALSTVDQRAAIESALSKWAPYFKVSFTEGPLSAARLKFRWTTTGFYGDFTQAVVGSDPSRSEPGLIALNLHKTWSTTTGTSPVYHLETALLRGIGSAMGMPSRSYVGPVMYYMYTGINDQLHLDDMHWSQWAYNHLSACSNYWVYSSGNAGQNFINTGDGNWHLTNWSISANDSYVSGDFSSDFGNELLMIKPGQKTLMLNYHNNSNLNSWTTKDVQISPFAGHWNGSTTDKRVVGDFDGDGLDEIMFANPNGYYATYGFSNGQWQQLQFAGNGDIDSDDSLLAGDFNGDGIDEVLLIKPGANAYYTMKLNTGTQTWDIIQSDTSGSIYWWGIQLSDYYVVGDFNGDGKAELLAMNPNGWHHTMAYSNNQWSYISGGGAGQIGYWNLGVNQKFVVSDTNYDGSEELIAYSLSSGWSHTMDFSSNQWQFQKGNDGTANIGFWDLSTQDFILANVPYEAYKMILNPNGSWKIIRSY